MAASSILLLTVGTGHQDNIQESLVDPILKSISMGHWSLVILLPSQSTTPYAEMVKAQWDMTEIEISPLPGAALEEDADACFEHFQTVIGRLLRQGAKPSDLVIDFTRGTKAMSAALLLAAVRCDIPVVRYLGQGRSGRDRIGHVKTGDERIIDILTTKVSAWKRLDAAYAFMIHGNFPAAVETVQGVEAFPEGELKETAHFVQQAGNIYSEWDRLDYEAALQSLQSMAISPVQDRFVCFIPSDEQKDLLQGLTLKVGKDDFPAWARRLRLLCADLLANAERRLRDGQFEDVQVRGYRVLELLGQVRLFDHGLNSSDLPADHYAVKQFNTELGKKKKGTSLPLNRDGNPYVSREYAARLLKRIPDAMGEKLLNIAKQLSFVDKRNKSILIHGFQTVGVQNPTKLRDELGAIVKLIIEDDPDNAPQRLEAARRMDFSRNQP